MPGIGTLTLGEFNALSSHLQEISFGLDKVDEIAPISLKARIIWNLLQA